MSNLLSSLSKTIHTSLALAIILFVGMFFHNEGIAFDTLFWSWLFRFIHVLVAIMWIGLLWYFNFVQIPNMPKICLLYTSPSPRDGLLSRMPSSA